MSVEDFKSKLHNIICEPAGFQEGFREPTLKLHPEPPPPTYSKRTIPLTDYLACNPCQACSKENKTVCDARVVGCITKNLYEPDLPENYESRIIDHKQQCDISRAADDHTTLVVCNRGGMTNLHTALAGLHPGYTISQKEYTDSTGKHTLMIQSCLPNHHTVHASTEFLKCAASDCRNRNIFNLNFSNFEDFGISRHRLQRIFHDKKFTLNLYERNQALFKIMPQMNQPFPTEHKKTIPSTMPKQQEPLKIEPGLPKSLKSEEAKKEKKFGEATILCNSDKIREETIKLMDSFPNLWAKNEWSIGTFKDKNTGRPVYFQLKLTNFSPVLQSPRFVSQNRQGPARALIGGMLDNGVIEPCYTRYAQNSVFVKKKAPRVTPEEWIKLGNKIEDYEPNIPHPNATEVYRHTLDWTDLNKNLADLPIAAAEPKAIFNSIQDNSIISVMDLACAYHACVLSPQSRQYAGFHTGLRDIGQMAYKRICMGCKQAATILQTAVQSALQDCSEWAHCLWDDIVLLADSEESMLERLSIVFTNLTRSGFLMKRHKLICYIGAKHPDVQLFGMKINLRTKVIAPLADKVKEILERPSPRNQSEMKSLLGAINWQASFLHGSAPYHATLHKMTHKNCQFVYTEERLQALEFFIDALTSPTCFNHLPSSELPFEIHSDASDFSGGMVLSQQEPSGRTRIISYQSIVFSERQIRMCTFEKESLTGLRAIECFWSFIEGHRTTWYTDSKNSVYLTIFSKTNSKVGRYRLFLESLDFLKIQWVPADSAGLRMADMLSRRSLSPKQCVNKQVKPEDMPKVDLIAKKLRNRFSYTISQAHYILDFISEQTEEDLRQIPDNSLYMDDKGKICVDRKGDLTDMDAIEIREQEQYMKTPKLETEEPAQEDDDIITIGEVRTRSKARREQEEAREDTREEPEQEQTRARPQENTTEQADNQEPQPPIQDQATLGELARQDAPKPQVTFGEAVTEILDKSALDEDIFLNIHLQEEDTEDLQPPASSLPPPDAPREEKFLHCIQHTSPFLSFKALSASQRKDPVFEPIIKKCEASTNDLWSRDNRINYFLAGKHKLLCREVADPTMRTCRLQLCIPRAHAFDLCLMAHRGSAGSVLTSKTPPTHFNPRKLCRLLSQKLYIHKLSDILEYIGQACQICIEAKPHRRNRRDYIRKTISVTRAGQVWYVDYLNISTKNSVWGYKDLLVLTDAYSNFTVACPVLKPTTQAYFIELLHTHIFQHYGKCTALYSDNASNLSGKLVRETATALNISHNTTNKFMPRASGAELSNKHILAAMRVQKEAYTMPPENWCYLLSGALVSMNFSPYQNSKTYTSPAIRFFGNASLAQNPQFFGSYMTEMTEQYDTEHSLLAGVKKADDILASLRQEHNAQRWREERDRERKEDPIFEPGDIVMIRFRPRPGREFAHKLTRRYKYQFAVVFCRGTTCWVRPYSLSSIDRWAGAVDLAKKSRNSNLVLPTYKVDTTDLVRISHGIHLWNTNKRKLHYSEFSMAKPEQTQIEVLQPLIPMPSLFTPERSQDTYSEYEDEKFSSGPNYEGEDDEDEEQDFCEQDMEDQLTDAKINVYYYDSDDELRVRGGKEPKRRTASVRQTSQATGETQEHTKVANCHFELKIMKESPDPETPDNTSAEPENPPPMTNPEPEASTSKSSILRKPLPIGERLARLAGYTLTPKDHTQSKKQITFHPKVRRLDWRGWIEEDIKEEAPRSQRVLNPRRPINNPLDATINHLDSKLLPKSLWSINDIKGCSCTTCHHAYNLTRKDTPCKTRCCEECVFHPPALWE